MKKIIALMLVILTLAALFVSCGNNNNINNPDETTPQGTNGDGTPIEGFTAVNETVYATEKVNVRSTPEVTADDAETNVIDQLAYGKDVTRTGINEATGWSRILFNNEVAYVRSEYLSTTKPEDTTDKNSDETDVDAAKFTACSDDTEIYATITDSDGKDVHAEGQEVNVYSAPNKGKKAAALKDGTAVKRVAVYYEKEDDHTYGWSKIEVTVENETKTYYVRNSQLKIEMVKEATDTTAAQ